MRPEVRDVLASTRARAAITEGRPGEVIRLARAALGMRQADLGALAGYTRSAITRIENGQRCATATATLTALAGHLGIPPADLGLGLDTARAAPTLAGEAAGEVDSVKRSTFLRGMAGTVGLLVLPTVLTTDAPHVGPADVDQVRLTLARLYELDAASGAGLVEARNVELITRLRYVLSTGSYTSTIGQHLRELLAAASENAGWTAYDAGRHREARAHWLEALHAADIGQYHAVRTVTLASMSLQAASLRHGAEAAQLAEAADRDPSATPVVRSIIAARSAEAHATTGDRAAAIAAMGRAEQLLAAGPRDDDPPWTSFWGEADLRSHETRAAVALRDFPRAERAIRRAVEVSRTGHARNHALYSAQYARILAARRAVDEAIAVATPAVTACRTVASERLRAAVRLVAVQVGRHDHARGRAFTAWASRMSG